VVRNCFQFLRTSAMLKHVIDIGWRLDVCPSVCMSVRHTLVLCRVARTHSRYWKLVNFNKRLRHFCHFHIFNDQLQSKSNPNPNPTQIHHKLTQTPCKHSTHTCLFSTSHCYVCLSNASPLSYFPYSFPPPIPYWDVQSSWNLHHVKALFSPNSTRGHSIGFPSTWPKS